MLYLKNIFEENIFNHFCNYDIDMHEIFAK